MIKKRSEENMRFLFYILMTGICLTGRLWAAVPETPEEARQMREEMLREAKVRAERMAQENAETPEQALELPPEAANWTAVEWQTFMDSQRVDFDQLIAEGDYQVIDETGSLKSLDDLKKRRAQTSGSNAE